MNDEIIYCRWKVARWNWKNGRRNGRIRQWLGIVFTRQRNLWLHIPACSPSIGPVNFIQAMNPALHEQAWADHQKWLRREFAK